MRCARRRWYRPSPSAQRVSWWASRFVSSLLFGLEPNDPLTMATAAAVLVGIGVLAGWFPARRASAVDPAIVLREG